MVFYPPTWASKLPFDPPDTIPICDFILDERYGRLPLDRSLDPYTCGVSGKSYTAGEQKQRTESLARGLAKELGWNVNQGTEFDKVAGVFAFNTIDIMTLNWAIHRLNGISSPANAAYSAEELMHQLKDSGAAALFTCLPLLPVALDAASKAGISKERIYICELPEQAQGGLKTADEFKTLGQLIKDGSSLPALEPIKWGAGQGARQTAFLCYSSGTSGLPKGVMISHRNVIANTLQVSTYDKPARDSIRKDYQDVALGPLPQSHIYALVVICHCSTYRGDQVVVLPKYDIQQYLNSIATYKVNSLYLVPPIIIAMAKNRPILDRFNLSSVRTIFTGAAPLGAEVAHLLQKQYPKWVIRQGYGLTETCTVVCSTSPHDVWFGSSGSILSGIECRLVTIGGEEITAYDQPGELLVKSPSVVLGYLKNEQATKETFVEDGQGGRWMRTGDEAVVKQGPKGHEHIWIVDRIKELIKVKGLQVAPAELEAHLLTHLAVADCAVIATPDEAAGEVPKAYVVKSQSVVLEENDRMVIREIQKHVENNKARHKWLKGGVEFIDVIPKSPSGKILRRLLRDKDRESRRQKGAKL
ncbi:hypothetical protein GJ744_000195 [Endocarpon pusillum]|uniref:Uncharacterized protein n=1 Tax=Endocarpon pusillum TaxID=364733 RepID=A0A8H7AS12_9EURO|nr:hypothetical protein GJ744_000195 [Endocarpon pusillum]